MSFNYYQPDKDWSSLRQEVKEIIFPHKRLGILGGMGVEATADLYSILNQLTREYIDVSTDQDYLSKRISDNPQVPDRSKFILYKTGESKETAEDPFPYLMFGIDDLANGRMPAQIIGMPCNTAHYFFQAMEEYVKERGYDVQLVNMVTETAKAIKDRYPNFKKVGLLATTATRKTKLYNNALEELGYEVIMSSDEDQQNLVMHAIFGHGREKGIKAGNKIEPGRKLAQAANTLQQQGAELIIAGCTEIPLVLKSDKGDAPLISPTEVLARKMIELAIET
jgi:aspartate racemase